MTALEFCAPSCKTVLENICGVVDWNTTIYALTHKKKIKNMRLDEQSNFEEKIVGE